MSLYWILKLDDIRVLVVVISIVSVIGFLAMFWYAFTEWNSNVPVKTLTKRWIVALSTITIIFSSAFVLIPSTKQAVTLAPHILNRENSKVLERLPKRVLETIDRSLIKLRELLEIKYPHKKGLTREY